MGCCGKFGDQEDNNVIRKFLCKYCVIKNSLISECLAELVGTSMLLMLVEFGIAMGILNTPAIIPLLQIGIGNALAVMTVVYITSGISGAHLNPAISFAMLCYGQLSIKKFFLFNLMQYIGGFFGSAVVYLQFHEIIFAKTNHTLLVPNAEGATAQIFATYPHPVQSLVGTFFDQIIGTGTLVLAVLTYGNKRHANLPSHFTPYIVGMTVLMLVFTTAAISEVALNPARDLGPRILSYLIGYGPEVFSHQDYLWFWMPVVGPYTGAGLTVLFYNIMMRLPLRYRDQSKQTMDSLDNNYTSKPDIVLREIRLKNKS